MINVYIYVFNTLADWEIAHVTSELNSRRFFKSDAQEINIKTVSTTKEPIRTMGGLMVLPDCTIEEIKLTKDSALILPGGLTWNTNVHQSILDIASKLNDIGAMVCAICGATQALASIGMLDNRPHTSNGVGFLDMFCPNYKGKEYYVDELVVVDKNLITASGVGGLLFAKEIINYLDVFKKESLEAWYEYYRNGTINAFYALYRSIKENK